MTVCDCDKTLTVAVRLTVKSLAPDSVTWWYNAKNSSSRPKIPVKCIGQTVSHAINGRKYQWGATPKKRTSVTNPISPHIKISYDSASGSVYNNHPANHTQNSKSNNDDNSLDNPSSNHRSSVSRPSKLKSCFQS